MPVEASGVSTAAAGAAVSAPSASRLRWELAIVLALSLGASAVYSIVALLNRVTREEALSSQTATLNRSLSEREGFDLTYQLLSIFFGLAPVALVCFLLWQGARPHLGRLGLGFDRPLRDASLGLALALAIGIPGLVAYFAGRALGLGVTVVPTGLDEYWWTVPVLLLSAARSAITEEVIAIGYLFVRLGELGWGRWRIILSSAVLRGSYHLYQGYGAFVANLVMGIVFGWLYTRFGRLLPLVVAHFVMDAVVFVGYPWAASAFPALFGLAA